MSDETLLQFTRQQARSSLGASVKGNNNVAVSNPPAAVAPVVALLACCILAWRSTATRLRPTGHASHDKHVSNKHVSNKHVSNTCQS
jgi:hypothetical protein